MSDWNGRARISRPRTGFLVALAAALALWAVSGGGGGGGPAPPRAPLRVGAAPPPPPPIRGTLEPGQTLGGLWSEHGLDPEELVGVTEAGRAIFSWRTLRPDTGYEFRFGPEGRFREFEVELDRDRRIVVYRTAGGFAARMEETPTVRTTRRLPEVCVQGSPWQSVAERGEDPALTVAMAEVLAAQVDFYTDLRAEDCFDLAFTVDERPDGSYRLVSLDAVRLQTSKKLFEAYRFSADGERFDYYDGEGRSLKRRFLRSPLKFARITSGFGARMHPILRRVRPHNGVDYAAPVGTPVQAAGHGVVGRAGWNGGYGRRVTIRHGDRYVTSYAHLSRIAPGIRPGANVSQGQVIGYVGSTGLSTGPHLDYRFMKDGRYVDPLSTNLPTAEPLDSERLDAFELERDRLRARLEGTGAVGPDALGPEEFLRAED